MAISVTAKNYSTRNHSSGNSFLLSNSGRIVTEYIDIVLNYNFQSTLDKQVMISAVNAITLLGGDWGDEGYAIGDNIHHITR